MNKIKQFVNDYGYSGWVVLVQHARDYPEDVKAQEMADELLGKLEAALEDAVKADWK